MAGAQRAFLRGLWRVIPRRKRPRFKAFREWVREHKLSLDNPKRREDYARKEPRRMHAVEKAARRLASIA